jgi:hypothetical protein
MLNGRHDTLHIDAQHNDTQHNWLICDTQHRHLAEQYFVPLCRVSGFFYCYAGCRYAECRYCECRGTAKCAAVQLTHQN